MPKVKVAPKAGGKKGTKPQIPAGPGAIAAGGGLDGSDKAELVKGEDKVESYEATGLDDALDLMTIVNAKSDKASVGQQAAGLERHPEVCPAFRMYILEAKQHIFSVGSRCVFCDDLEFFFGAQFSRLLSKHTKNANYQSQSKRSVGLDAYLLYVH